MNMQRATDYMLEFINGFINDKITRNSFKANFGFQYSQNLVRMRSEDAEFANAMGHFILDTGIHVSSHMSDGAFKALIRLRYHELIDTLREEIY